MGAHIAAVGRREKPMVTGSVQDLRAKEPIPDRGTTVSKCQESILGRGNFIHTTTCRYTLDMIFPENKTPLLATITAMATVIFS